MTIQEDVARVHALMAERAMNEALQACDGDLQAAVKWAQEKAQTDRNWFYRLGGAELQAIAGRVALAAMAEAAIEVAEASEQPPKAVH